MNCDELKTHTPQSRDPNEPQEDAENAMSTPERKDDNISEQLTTIKKEKT